MIDTGPSWPGEIYYHTSLVTFLFITADTTIGKDFVIQVRHVGDTYYCHRYGHTVHSQGIVSRCLDTALLLEIIVTRKGQRRGWYLWSQVLSDGEIILFTELLEGFYCHGYTYIHMCDTKYDHRKLFSYEKQHFPR